MDIANASTSAESIVKVGDTVSFVMDAGPYRGTDRPAFVVRKSETSVNLVVFVDGSNDITAENGMVRCTYWATSVHYSDDKEKHRTWHWPD